MSDAKQTLRDILDELWVFPELEGVQMDEITGSFVQKNFHMGEYRDAAAKLDASNVDDPVYQIHKENQETARKSV